MRRMVKLRQYPPICLDGLLRTKSIHYVKLWRSEIRNLKLLRIDIDTYDTKEANYIHDLSQVRE